MSDKATLTYGGKTYEIPVLTGSEGEKALDIAKLRQDTGLVTIDPGFGNTAACTSDITFLDGEAGVLRYRGYPIEQLADQATFVEVAYLLIYGRLPSQREYDSFQNALTRHSLLHEDIKNVFAAFPPDAHPMAILSSVVSALSTFYQDSHDPNDEKQVEISTIRLIAKLPTIAAFAFKKSCGQPFIYPDNALGYTSNFMRMMFAFPTEPYVVDYDIARALDTLFILHADHEQNCSTSTVRLVGSGRANLFASISAGICALWGRLHGGANQEVLEMLQKMYEEGGNVQKYVELSKQKDSGFRLMGFGHRVYKNFDPRATIIKREADMVLAKLNIKDPVLDLARRLEEAALKDQYFIDRKLYPNVDYYSGIIYRALNIPVNMFTVLFAIGRLPGWVAQWREMVAQRSRIGRPRQIYTGATKRDYVPMEKR
ncbi:MAG TPA: citrate synthase [Myxococcota bacterium]|jgi:citrate synthase|nr:citrate synthase [Myxococcota bacterium]